MNISEILDSLETLVARLRATEQARAACEAALQSENEARSQLRPTLAALRLLLQGSLSAEQLVTCGLAPKKKARSLGSDERTAATVKLRATREANGTRGLRQTRIAKARAVIDAAYASGTPPSATGEPAGASSPSQ